MAVTEENNVNQETLQEAAQNTGENIAKAENGMEDNSAAQQESDREDGMDIVPKEAETSKDKTVLKSLSGIAPGTILDPSQLDLSNPGQYFNSWSIEEGDNLYARINGKSWRPNNDVPLSSLVYLKMPHYNFDGKIQVGEMIVNRDVEQDVKAVFQELFENQYEIQSMYLVDNYWTGNPDSTDTASIDVNNTSAFCYRQVTNGKKLSNHAYGKAIDLNPQQNPYVSYSSGTAKWYHQNANDYIDRDTGLEHVITHEDLAYKVFRKYGFSWGGDWSNPKDYQHFDKN